MTLCSNYFSLPKQKSCHQDIVCAPMILCEAPSHLTQKNLEVFVGEITGLKKMLIDHNSANRVPFLVKRICE